MKVPEAEEKVRETIIEIRKVFTNKKWCKWADAWLLSMDRSVESAVSIAEDIWRAAVLLQRRLPVDHLLVELSFPCPPEMPRLRQQSSLEAVMSSINSPP